MEETKRCTKCGEVKPLTAFHHSKSSVDGRRSACKACVCAASRKYREQNRGKLAERYRKHREQNREKVTARNIKYNACVKRPSCPLVGGLGAEFMIFTCEVCGREFRRIKSRVDWNYEHRGDIPRFCSRACRYAAMRKNYKSPYAKKIEEIKQRLKS